MHILCNAGIIRPSCHSYVAYASDDSPPKQLNQQAIDLSNLHLTYFVKTRMEVVRTIY